MRKIAQKQTMMHAMSWSADYPDADAFLSLLYKADQSVDLGSYFSNATYNALYEKATVMEHSPERTAIYEQLNRIAAEQVPAVYTVHGMRPVIYQGWVKNYLWADCLSGEEQYINIDLEKKRQLQANR
jgi:ABC-type transport system substrate-binding protein